MNQPMWQGSRSAQKTSSGRPEVSVLSGPSRQRRPVLDDAVTVDAQYVVAEEAQLSLDNHSADGPPGREQVTLDDRAHRERERQFRNIARVSPITAVSSAGPAISRSGQ